MSSFLEVVEFIEDANSIAGIVLNSILLIAIKRFSRPQLGTYKHLLTIFASVDIFLVILHNVVHPALDAAIVLLLFADFRRGLIGMLVKRNEAMGGPTTLHITSTVVHSVATVSTVAPN